MEIPSVSNSSELSSPPSSSPTSSSPPSSSPPLHPFDELAVFADLAKNAALARLDEYVENPSANNAHFAIQISKLAFQILHSIRVRVSEDRVTDVNQSQPRKGYYANRRHVYSGSRRGFSSSSIHSSTFGAGGGGDIMDFRFRNPPPLRSKLTLNELRIVNDALSESGNEKDEIVHGYKVRILRRDMRTLRDETWLNDEIINMVSNLVKDFLKTREEGDQEGRVPKIYLPFTFFTSKLMGDTTEIYGYDNVKRWTSKANVDVFECDFLVFPRNIKNMHWACVFMDMKNKIIWNIDSLGSSDNKFSDVLLRWLRDEHLEKKKSVLDTRHWKIQGPPSDLPKQDNGSDCGMFLCLFIYYLAHGMIPTNDNFSQGNVPHLRNLIALWIIQQRVS
jgi:hypothetical protein